MNAIIEALPSLIPTTRPASPSDAMCIQDVFGETDSGSMMGLFNRCSPCVVAAPGAQGKSSFVSWLVALMRGTEWSRYRAHVVAPPPEAFRDVRSAAQALEVALGAQPGSKHFGDILRTSTVVSQHRAADAITVLMLDIGSCQSQDVMSWLAHNMFALGDYGPTGSGELRVMPILVGAYDLTALETGPVSDYDFGHVSLRNITPAETTRAIVRMCTDASVYGRLRFDDDAANEVFVQTTGDKYFTNLLVGESVVRAASASGGEGIVVERADVVGAADRFRMGRVKERIVMPQLRRLMNHDAETWGAALRLLQSGGEAWETVGRRERRRLFQCGIVGPIPTEARSSGLSSVVGGDGSQSTVDYAIRNPMVADYLERVARKATAKTDEGRRWHVLLDKSAAGTLEGPEAVEFGELARRVAVADATELDKAGAALQIYDMVHDTVMRRMYEMVAEIRALRERSP